MSSQHIRNTGNPIWFDAAAAAAAAAVAEAEAEAERCGAITNRRGG